MTSNKIIDNLLIIDKHCFQVLAKTMLQKQQTNPVSHKKAEVHNNTTEIDVPKVSWLVSN